MASSNGRDSSKVTASMDSLKFSSKNSSLISSKESVLSKKDKECLQMQECKKKLLANEQQIIIRDNNVLLKSPPQKKIIMPPVINPEELAASTPTQRNWRGILIALLVIAAVLGLIVFSIVLLTPAIDGQRQRGRRVNLAHMVAGKYTFKSFNGSWLSDEELVYRDRWGGLTLFNVKNLTTKMLMNNSTFRELNAVDFKVSPDLKFVLLVSDVRPGWRHGRLARYHVYDVINRIKITISPIEDDRTAPLLQYAEWSPAGSGLVFVHDNDIYYKPKVLKTLVCRITSSGVPGVIFNGIPDFIYETEILRLEKALWFSPDGQHLMYVTYNDTEVPELRYPWYGLNTPEPPAYPSVKSIRYPKMGANNPVVTLYLVSLKTPKFLFPHAIQFTTEGNDWYLRWSSWSSERQMVVMLLNRPQNVTVISICNLQHTCQDLTRTESSTQWSDVGAEPSDSDCGWCGGSGIVGVGGRWFTSAGVNDPEGGRWRHAVEVSRSGLAPLTQGAFEISQVLGWDDRRKLLYVMGTSPGRSGERHLYRVWAGDPPSPPRCLTCDPDTDLHMDVPPDDEQEMFENTTSSLSDWPTSTVLPHVTDENDTTLQPCLYNMIYFSTNFTYYVQECLGPVAGWVRVVGREAVWLGGGGAVRRRVDSLLTPIQRVFKVEIQADRTARVRLLLPPGYKETDDLPLPLILHISSSPGEQLVTEKWKIDWDWYMAATKNFIVAQIDASGSGGQGEELRTDIYQKALTADVGDQIAVLSYLRDNLKMVDGGRVGVWGRGYGGGAALQLANEEPRNLTRCLAAIAPLADLTHYASFWSERWCGYGSSGRGIASANAVWRGVGNIPPRRVLLAHATADLKVAPRHTLAIAKALQNANAVYNHQVYPDEGHEFGRSSLHLYNTMEQFFDECFGPVELADWDLNGMGGLFPFRE